jgi:hypothetical protein
MMGISGHLRPIATAIESGSFDKKQAKKRPAGKSGPNPIPCRSWRRQRDYRVLHDINQMLIFNVCHSFCECVDAAGRGSGMDFLLHLG